MSKTRGNMGCNGFCSKKRSRCVCNAKDSVMQSKRVLGGEKGMQVGSRAAPDQCYYYKAWRRPIIRASMARSGSRSRASRIKRYSDSRKRRSAKMKKVTKKACLPAMGMTKPAENCVCLVDGERSCRVRRCSSSLSCHAELANVGHRWHR